MRTREQWTWIWASAWDVRFSALPGVGCPFTRRWFRTRFQRTGQPDSPTLVYRLRKQGGIDFLIPSTDQTGLPGSIQHLEGDFGAVVTPGLELAFKDRRQRRLTDTIPSGARASRDIWVCGPGAFTVAKALAFGERTENKDAHDLFYVWRAIGIPEVTEGLSLVIPDPAVEQALDVIERDFSQFGGPGPIAAARFIAGGFDDGIQADVSGFAVALLRAIRRE